MNQDIIEEFKEKNEKILKDKLLLDIDNNVDTLFHAIDNYASQKIIEAKSRIFDIYEQAGLSAINKQVEKLIEDYGTVIQKESKELIMIRVSEMKDNIPKIKLEESDMECYFLVVKKLFENYADEYIKKISNYLNNNLIVNIKKTNKMLDEESTAYKRIVDLLQSSLPNNLSRKIEEYLKDRSRAIENNAKESFLRVKRANDITVEKLIK